LSVAYYRCESTGSLTTLYNVTSNYYLQCPQCENARGSARRARFKNFHELSARGQVSMRREAIRRSAPEQCAQTATPTAAVPMRLNATTKGVFQCAKPALLPTSATVLYQHSELSTRLLRKNTERLIRGRGTKERHRTNAPQNAGCQSSNPKRTKRLLRRLPQNTSQNANIFQCTPMRHWPRV